MVAVGRSGKRLAVTLAAVVFGLFGIVSIGLYYSAARDARILLREEPLTLDAVTNAMTLDLVNTSIVSRDESAYMYRMKKSPEVYAIIHAHHKTGAVAHSEIRMGSDDAPVEFYANPRRFYVALVLAGATYLASAFAAFRLLTRTIPKRFFAYAIGGLLLVGFAGGQPFLARWLFLALDKTIP